MINEIETKYLQLDKYNLSWYQKRVFELYLELGTLRKVASKLDIPLTYIWKAVNEVKTIIKEHE